MTFLKQNVEGKKLRISRTLDWIFVRLARRHFSPPTKFGSGPHDCALTALYWAVPQISEDKIKEAFMFCGEGWPYHGITNKEFTIALKYMKLNYEYYHNDTDTISDLYKRKPKRCVALVYGHFIALSDGKILGDDSRTIWNSMERIYCYWVFY